MQQWTASMNLGMQSAGRRCWPAGHRAAGQRPGRQEWRAGVSHSGFQTMESTDKSTSIILPCPAISCHLLWELGAGPEPWKVLSASQFRMELLSCRPYVTNTGEGVSPKLDAFLFLGAILGSWEEPAIVPN